MKGAGKPSSELRSMVKASEQRVDKQQVELRVSCAACRCSVALHRSELTQVLVVRQRCASRGWQRKEATGATDRWCLQRLSWTWGSSNRQRTRDPVLLVLSLHRPQTERYTITLFIIANKINNKVQSDGVMLHCFLGIRFDLLS